MLPAITGQVKLYLHSLVTAFLRQFGDKVEYMMFINSA